MKIIIGKMAVWISDVIFKTVILWAAGYKRLDSGRYVQPPFVLYIQREFAVESAEKQLRRAATGW